MVTLFARCLGLLTLAIHMVVVAQGRQAVVANGHDHPLLGSTKQQQAVLLSDISNDRVTTDQSDLAAEQPAVAIADAEKKSPTLLSRLRNVGFEAVVKLYPPVEAAISLGKVIQSGPSIEEVVKKTAATALQTTFPAAVFAWSQAAASVRRSSVVNIAALSANVSAAQMVVEELSMEERVAKQAAANGAAAMRARSASEAIRRTFNALGSLTLEELHQDLWNRGIHGHMTTSTKEEMMLKVARVRLASKLESLGEDVLRDELHLLGRDAVENATAAKMASQLATAAYYRGGLPAPWDLCYADVVGSLEEDGEMRIVNFSSNLPGVDIDLIITNTSEYKLANSSQNRLTKCLGVINVLQSTTVDLSFRFVRSGTMELLPFSYAELTVYDLSGDGNEAVSSVVRTPPGEAEGFRAASETKVITTGTAALGYSFISASPGASIFQPESFPITEMDQSRTFTLRYSDANSLRMSFSAGQVRRLHPHGVHGRNFVFGGSVVIQDPSVATLFASMEEAGSSTEVEGASMEEDVASAEEADIYGSNLPSRDDAGEEDSALEEEESEIHSSYRSSRDDAGESEDEEGETHSKHNERHASRTTAEEESKSAEGEGAHYSKNGARQESRRAKAEDGSDSKDEEGETYTIGPRTAREEEEVGSVDEGRDTFSMHLAPFAANGDRAAMASADAGEVEDALERNVVGPSNPEEIAPVYIDPTDCSRQCFLLGDSEVVTFDASRKVASLDDYVKVRHHDKPKLEDAGEVWLVDTEDVSIQALYNSSYRSGQTLSALAIGGRILGGSKFVVKPLGQPVSWDDKAILQDFPSAFINDVVSAYYPSSSKQVSEGPVGQGIDIRLSGDIRLIVRRWNDHLDATIRMCPQESQRGECGRFGIRAEGIADARNVAPSESLFERSSIQHRNHERESFLSPFDESGMH